MVPGFILFLVANILNNVLFGLYVSMVAECFRVTIQKYRNTGKVNKVLLTCFVLITLLATTKIVVDNVLTVRAFAFPTPDGQPQYEPITSPLAFAVNALWLIQTIVADSFVVYRVWILWSPNYLVGVVPKIIIDNVLTVKAFAFPTPDSQPQYEPMTSPSAFALNILWILQTIIADSFAAYRVWIIWWPNYLVGLLPAFLSFACLGVVGYDLWVFSDRADLQTFTYAIKAFLSLTLALNLMSTGLIAYRVWSIRRQIQSFPVPSGMGAPKVIERDPVKNAVAIIVESALIYTIFLTIDLIFLAINSVYSSLFTPMIPQVIALVFGSVIIRSSQGHGVEDTTFSAHNVSRTMPLFASHHPRRSTHTDNLPVALERVVTIQVDEDNRSSGTSNVRKG